mmetsp:Transcript_18093/g.30891  ORF Transcript_18093/g.30891 Transcript_18093/m.30891 type:complete len:540 (-) Transcript_18093:58-1677(-)
MLLLLVLGLVEIEALLGDALELLVIVVLHLLDHVLVDGVDEVEDLEPLLLEGLDEGRLGDGGSALAGDVVDVLLALLHPLDVVLEGDEVLATLGGVESEEVGELLPVGGVLVDSELEVLGELLVELLVVLLVLGDLGEHLEALLDDVLLDDLEDSVLLQGLSRDVQGQVVGVDDSLHEGEPLGDEVLAVVHDEDSSHVELEVVLLLLVLEEVEGSALGHEEEGGELELALDAEVLDGKVLLPVVGEALVEADVLVLGDVLGLPHPDGLGLVEDLVLVGDLLDLLHLLLLGLLLVLDLGLLVVLHLLVVLVGVGDLLVGGLLDHELDGEADEFGVLFDEVLELSLLEELLLVLLEVEHDLGSSLDVLRVVGVDREGSSGVGLPLELLVVVVLGDHSHLLGHEVGGVETHSELTDHADVGASGDGLHEVPGAGLGDGSEVVDEVALGHSDSTVVDGEGVVSLVRNDPDFEVGLGLELLGLRDRVVPDLVEGVGGVGDELSQEDLLVGVEGVDDETHQLLDVGVEGEDLFTHFWLRMRVFLN